MVRPLCLWYGCDTRNSPQISGGIATRICNTAACPLLIKITRNSPQISGGIATPFSFKGEFLVISRLGIALKSVVGLRLTTLFLPLNIKRISLGIALKSVVGLRPRAHTG